MQHTTNYHEHTASSCFGKAATFKGKETSAKRKRQTEINCECRYRFPRRKKRKTIVQNASEEKVKWYFWDGSFDERHLKEVCNKRKRYDIFQNISCEAISQSKLTCNTNIAPIIQGPMGQYSFKYNFKDTQKEDTEEYGRAKAAMQKVLPQLRKYESDRSESMRRVLSAPFAHQKVNIVGASMASFLTRNKSRFIFSHETAWCPLRDIKTLLDEGQATASVVYHRSQTPHFQCAALHYLCRPLELENICAFDFYSMYEVIPVTMYNENEVLAFNNGHFHHPSHVHKKRRFLQGVRIRKKKHLLKIYQ
jgi:hypothetical protein